ncbi:MAG: hypothetical protein M1442_04415 [Candidatus Thermoplasmatota archaeon]|nr:hypothetical protein [Candidatus Thermoplasmatota archaeon]
MNASTDKPFISAIVMAHYRNPFVHVAMASVLKQTLDRNLYEVIFSKILTLKVMNSGDIRSSKCYS